MLSFDQPFRPQYHYTPRKNWMNDPNGLVYHDGTYHLFHQYNPEGDTWGHMSWYHAVSPDLVHWEHRGVAIPEEGNEMIFSGSAVVDAGNTSGLGNEDGPPPLVAVYTSHYTHDGGAFDEAQSLAYSNDAGRTWTKFEGNPVLDHPDANFRDPNVFWHEPSERWIMAVALPTRHTVQLYGSADLKRWSHLSDFGPAGATGGIWECPALFQVPVADTGRLAWVLQVDLNPGSVAGGSGGQYFLGTFDGTRFTPREGRDLSEPRWVDHGPDFYAAIPWSNIPASVGRTPWLGWMNNWRYAEQIPTSPWRSAMTIPRSVTLRSVEGEPRLVQQPVSELEQLREDPVQVSERSVTSETIRLPADAGGGRTVEFVAVFAPESADTVGVNVCVGPDEKTVVGYDSENKTVFVDRRMSGRTDFDDGFAARDDAPLTPVEGRVKIHILIDRSSLEVFANDGARVLTHRIFPSPSSTATEVFARNGTARLVRFTAWTLRSIWPTNA